MTFANNMDRDQAPRIIGPDLRSILFDNKYQFLLKTFIFASYDLNSEDIEICYFTNCPRTFGGHCIFGVSLRNRP